MPRRNQGAAQAHARDQVGGIARALNAEPAAQGDAVPTPTAHYENELQAPAVPRIRLNREQLNDAFPPARYVGLGYRRPDNPNLVRDRVLDYYDTWTESRSEYDKRQKEGERRNGAIRNLALRLGLEPLPDGDDGHMAIETVAGEKYDLSMIMTLFLDKMDKMIPYMDILETAFKGK